MFAVLYKVIIIPTLSTKLCLLEEERINYIYLNDFIIRIVIYISQYAITAVRSAV